jgi:MFS family permease
MLALVWGGNQFPWASFEVIGMFILSAILFAGFGWTENKHAKDPILPLDLFKNPIFRISMIVVFLVGMEMFGAILYIPLFAQDVMGRTATNSGVIMTPMVLSLVFVSIIAGQAVSRTGRYKGLAIFGMAAVTLGMLWLATMGVHTTSGQFTVRMILLGVGLGFGMPIFNLIVQNAVPHSLLGIATASVQLFRSIGATIGVAVMGSILNNRLAHNLGGGSHFSANQLQNVSAHSIPEPVKNALSHSISNVFLIGGIVVSLAFFASWFLKEIPLRTHQDYPTAAEGGAPGMAPVSR